jgi:deoxycytidylate deaminase
MKQTIQDSHFSFDVDRLITQDNVDKHPRFGRFMEIARAISELSNYDKYRLGACVILKKQIIAKGFNKAKTHPVQKHYNAMRFDVSDKSRHYIHAETAALNQVKHLDLTGAELFVYHTGVNGEQKMARPCAACMKYAKQLGIKKIHYSTPDGFATEHISKENLIFVKRAKKPI